MSRSGWPTAWFRQSKYTLVHYIHAYLSSDTAPQVQTRDQPWARNMSKTITKECRVCHVTKPLDDFPLDGHRPDGRHPYCKPCKSAGQRVRSRQPDAILNQRARDAAKRGSVFTNNGRTCFRCKQVRPLSEFGWDGQRLASILCLSCQYASSHCCFCGRNVPTADCTTCRYRRDLAYRETKKAYQRRYRAINLKAINDQISKRRRRQFSEGDAPYERSPEQWLKHLLRRTRKRLAVLSTNGRPSPRLAITNDFLIWLWEQQDGLCALSGLPMAYWCNDMRSASIDRITPGGDYSQDNIQLVCIAMNYLKSNFTSIAVADFIHELRTPMSMFNQQPVISGQPPEENENVS